METHQGRQEEEMAEEEETWEETEWRVKHIVRTNGDIRIRSGRIFFSREDEEKYGRAIAEAELALLSDELNLYKHHVNLAVQYFCDPEILKGVLEQTEMRDDICRDGLLPIHIALTNLRELKYVARWTRGDSIFKLMILLCLPESESQEMFPGIVE